MSEKLNLQTVVHEHQQEPSLEIQKKAEEIVSEVLEQKKVENSGEPLKGEQRRLAMAETANNILNELNVVEVDVDDPNNAELIKERRKMRAVARHIFTLIHKDSVQEQAEELENYLKQRHAEREQPLAGSTSNRVH